MAQQPFKLDPIRPPAVRDESGRFKEQPAPQAGPVNPVAVEAAGGTPQNWAPKIGQNTAPTRSPLIPLPPASTGVKPFKVGDSR